MDRNLIENKAEVWSILGWFKNIDFKENIYSHKTLRDTFGIIYLLCSNSLSKKAK